MEPSLMKFRQVLRKKGRRWLNFMKYSYFKIFTIYIAVSLTMTIIYVGSQWLFASDLDLKPQLTPEAEGSFFVFALALLPFTLFLEDLGIRLMPWIFIHDIFRLHTIEVKQTGKNDWEISDKRKWRTWLYRNNRAFYIVVSALWNSLLHQSNVFAANSAGRILYFGIHVVTGSMLAWIFINKGFWESYTVHVSWDFLLIGMVALISLFSL
jgi:hypothetical protein